MGYELKRQEKKGGFAKKQTKNRKYTQPSSSEKRFLSKTTQKKNTPFSLWRKKYFFIIYFLGEFRNGIFFRRERKGFLLLLCVDIFFLFLIMFFRKLYKNIYSLFFLSFSSLSLFSLYIFSIFNNTETIAFHLTTKNLFLYLYHKIYF